MVALGLRRYQNGIRGRWGWLLLGGRRYQNGIRGRGELGYGLAEGRVVLVRSGGDEGGDGLAVGFASSLACVAARSMSCWWSVMEISASRCSLWSSAVRMRSALSSWSVSLAVMSPLVSASSRSDARDDLSRWQESTVAAMPIWRPCLP